MSTFAVFACLMRKHAPFVLLVAAFTALLFGEVLIGRAVLWGGDLQTAFYPFLYSFQKQLHQGHLNLWDSSWGLGHPQLAEGQSCQLYPPMVLLLLFLPYWKALNLFIISHYLLAALGTYLFAMRRGLSAASAMLAACAFAFSGFMMVHCIHPTVIAALAWMPFVLLFVDKAVSDGRIFPSLLWAGVVLALQILGGQSQCVFFTVLIATAFLLCRCVARRDVGRWKQVTGGVFLMVAVAALITLPQLLATYQLKSVTLREVLSRDIYVKSLGLSLKSLLSLTLPYCWGGPENYAGDAYFWESTAYVTALPWLLLPPLVMLRPRSRETWFWVGVLIFGITFAVTQHNPLYNLLPHIPVFNWFRVPARYLLLSTFALAILLGRGHHVLSSPVGVDQQRKVAGVVALTGLFILVAAAALLMGVQLKVNLLRDVWSSPTFQQALFGTDGCFLLVEAIVGSILLIALARRSISPHLTTLLLAIMLLADLSRVGVAMQCKVDPAIFVYEPPVAEFLKSKPGPFRILTAINPASAARFEEVRRLPPEYQETAMLRPNLNVLHGLANLDVYVALEILSAFNFRTLCTLPMDEALLTYSRAMSRERVTLRGPGWKQRHQLLSLLNIRYVVTTESITAPGWRLVFDRGVRVYENQGVFPRAFLVGAARQASPEEALRHLMTGDIDFSSVALVEQDLSFRLPTQPPVGFRGTVSAMKYRDTEVALRTRAGHPALLVLADSYYPGWQATVDGQGAPILQTDYGLRGVEVSSGEHVVVFRYQPPGWRLAVLVSLCTVAAVFAALVVTGTRGRREPSCR